MRNKVKHNAGNNIKKQKLASKYRSRRDRESNHGPLLAYGGKESTATLNNDVRFINVKIGVRRRKGRDGVVVSTSARQQEPHGSILGPGVTDF